MTKEELIALSDLNREDNIKYISSEAQGIAITLESDKYAPTFCKLERAYICGRRNSEEQIAELEKDKQYFSDNLDKQIEATLKLQQENEELKADNDARKFAMAMSEKVEKQLREENTKLKLKLEALEGQTPWKDIKDKSELIKENVQLKKEWQEQVQKATDEGQGWCGKSDGSKAI